MRFILPIVCLALPALAQQCSFSLSPPSANFSAAGGTGLITIVASNNSCSRTATSGVEWITISFGQIGDGGGTVGYTVRPNTSPNQRSASIQIAGQAFTVTQAAASCEFVLNPSSATVPAAGSSGSFDVTSSCTWNASTTAPWITVSSSAGRVNWTAAPNTTTTQRSAAITVGNASFTLTQPGQCVFTFTTSQASFSAAGGSGTITIDASNNACERPASSTVPWITLLSGQTGTGDGSIQFTVAPNPSASPRNGAIQIGSQSVAIGQFGSACQYTLTPPQITVPVSGAAGSFAVATSCEWTPISNSAWLVITSGRTATTGAGTVSYAATANPEPHPRSGAIQIGNVLFIISQPAATCDISLQPQEISAASEGFTGAVNVYTLPSCNWAAASTVDWIVLSNPSSGIGDGTIAFQVLANATPRIRTGEVTIGNKVLRVTQAAAPCNAAVTPRALTIPASGGNGTITIATNCDWSTSASAGWVRLGSPASGAGNGSVSFSVSANTAPESRTATITIAAQAITITQPAAGCGALTLSAPSITLPARGGMASVDVSGSPACEWSASSGDAWAQVSWASVAGSGRVSVAAPPNATGSERSGSVQISGQSLRVIQPPIVVRLAPGAVVNAASFAAGPVSPGLIVSVFGTGFETGSITTYQLTPDRTALTQVLAGTRLLFDGAAAPMIYTSDGQLNAIVPYAVAGKTSTEVQVEFLGVRSNALTIPVQAASPAIFPGAVLNQDYAVNGITSPADRGSIVQIFATGEGQTIPAGTDGKLAVPPLPRPASPVRVLIGGLEAEVLYAGGAPGLVAGLIQINARVPREVVVGPSIPVVIEIAGKASPAGVTIAVR